MSSPPTSEIALRVLRLEQQLDSYQRLHAEELEQIRRSLGELKQQVLRLGALEERLNPTGAENNQS